MHSYQRTTRVKGRTRPRKETGRVRMKASSLKQSPSAPSLRLPSLVIVMVLLSISNWGIDRSNEPCFGISPFHLGAVQAFAPLRIVVPTTRSSRKLEGGHGERGKTSAQIISSSRLNMSWMMTTVDEKATSVETEESSTTIPFVIERIPSSSSSSSGVPTNERVFQEISQMCIQAFFNDGPTQPASPASSTAPPLPPVRPAPIWKELQLKSLRTLQQSDLKVRRQKHAQTNVMFLARRVVALGNNMDEDEGDKGESWIRSRPLILNNNAIYNLPSSKKDMDFVSGEVMGFVEVTLRPYGLGNAGPVTAEDGLLYADETSLKPSPGTQEASPLRPILTNLSVQYEARQSGVATRLMALCEDYVQRAWRKSEIVLEVEDDNHRALAFYQKRGYLIVQQDPTSRRYDTNGLFLRQLRCNRMIMQKRLGGMNGASTSKRLVGNNNISDEVFGVGKALQRFRDSFFASSSSSMQFYY